MALESRQPPAAHLLVSQTRGSTQEIAYPPPKGDSLLSLRDAPTLGQSVRRAAPRQHPLPGGSPVEGPTGRARRVEAQSIAGCPASLPSNTLAGQSDPTVAPPPEQGGDQALPTRYVS